MARLDLDFTLFDANKLFYGARVLMSGANLNDFQKNPVMLLQHNRPKEFSGKSGMMLPIGSWYDIRIEGSALLAKPDFDDSDDLAVRVQRKVEKGYLNGAEVKLEPFEISDEARLKLDRQTAPTIVKWGVFYGTIMDIPNSGTLAVRKLTTSDSSVKLHTGETLNLLSSSEQTELNELLLRTGIDLYLKGDLEKLQKLSMPIFRVKYKEAFGIDFT